MDKTKAAQAKTAMTITDGM